MVNFTYILTLQHDTEAIYSFVEFIISSLKAQFINIQTVDISH